MRKNYLKLLAAILLSTITCSMILTACKKSEPDASDVSTGLTEDSGTAENTTPDDPQNPDNTTPDDETYKHVVVIGVDGAGAFFKEADTPNIDRIFADGAVTYKCLASNPTISAQCWGSLLHGVTPAVHGITNSIAENTAYPADSKFPSFFRVIRENDANAVLASFCNWSAINFGIVENDIGVYKMSGLADAVITTRVCSYVKSNSPKALFIQFDDADHAGHSSGYGTATHIESIETIDGYIGRIYAAYEEAGILDDTLFIVTADHGGSGKSHGGLTDAEKYVMFAATGKTVEKGEIQDIELRDTAAIVLYALGYTAPETWTSRVPSGLFKGVTAGERPVYVNKDSERYHESEPTPTVDSPEYVTNYITNHNLSTYLTFDGGITDACNGNITQTGNLYFVDGYFGQGVALDDGYVSINDHTPGTDSFTVALWMKTEGLDTSDPCVFSNKDWGSGKNSGYVLSLDKSQKLRFNMGKDGSSRLDVDAALPSDFREGWMHVILIVDRESNEISVCYDFGAATTVAIPAALQNVSLNAFSSLNIGQDGTGNYSVGLPATVDEFMIFDGAFDRADIAALSDYYGKSNATADYRNNSSETPAKDGDGYITNFITDKELQTYLTFDESVNDSTEKSSVTANGNVSYESGFFGEAIKLDNGYVSISDFALGNESFSAAFWIKTEGVTGDPAIISNKDWGNGKNNGFVVALQDDHVVKLNFGNGNDRIDGSYDLPADYQTGWVYVVFVFDRENGEMKISFDFNEFAVLELSDALMSSSADGYNVLNIGQDGTGSYEDSLIATLDEFMLFKGALDNDDVKSLSEYFAVEIN